MLGPQEVKSELNLSMPKAEVNQRQFLRVKPAFKQPIKVDINGENFIDVLHARDISEAGIGIRVPHFFDGCAIDKPVNFIISLPEPIKKTIRACGLVKHAGDAHFGVYFTQIDRQAIKLLREYISFRIAEDGEWIKSLAFKFGFIQ